MSKHLKIFANKKTFSDWGIIRLFVELRVENIMYAAHERKMVVLYLRFSPSKFNDNLSVANCFNCSSSDLSILRILKLPAIKPPFGWSASSIVAGDYLRQVIFYHLFTCSFHFPFSSAVSRNKFWHLVLKLCIYNKNIFNIMCK